jgi:hypothetical protein
MRIRLAAIALLFSISSTAWADLRVFDVEPRYQQEVYEALKGVLVSNPQFMAPGTTFGNVELLASGQIMVNAGAETLTQVEQVIKAIRERPVAAAPRVSLRYWAVLGTRAPANTANQIGAPPPPVLNDVLTELRRLNGDLTFRVIGSAAVTSDSGQSGEVSGTPMSVAQVAHVQGDMLNAYMSIQLHGTPTQVTIVGQVTISSELKLRTTLKRGEFVVLGENQLQGGGLDGPVFYIVHWAN